MDPTRIQCQRTVLFVDGFAQNVTWEFFFFFFLPPLLSSRRHTNGSGFIFITVAGDYILKFIFCSSFTVACLCVKTHLVKLVFYRFKSSVMG